MFLADMITDEINAAISELATLTVARIKNQTEASVRRICITDLNSETAKINKLIYERIVFAITGNDAGISSKAMEQLKNAISDIDKKI
jgi:hypothetical protein